MRESFFTPGEKPVTVTYIKDIKTGIVICYEVQSKEVNKALRKNKLDLIIHSLANMPGMAKIVEVERTV